MSRNVKEAIVLPRNFSKVRSTVIFYIKSSSQLIFENYYVSRSVKEAILYRLKEEQGVDKSLDDVDRVCVCVSVCVCG